MAKKITGERIPKKGEVELFEHKLDFLKSKIEEVETYLRKHAWDKMPEEKRAGAFKFQADLVNQSIEWLQKYADMMGLAAFYRKYAEAQKTARKGFENPTGAQDLFRGKTALEISDV
jgi:hypothetical protein